MTEPNISENEFKFVATEMQIRTLFRSVSDRVSLPNSEYSVEGLMNELIKHWIPVVECHKCGRYPACKYIQKYSSGKVKDIQCGVTIECVRNLVVGSWSIICKYDKRQKEIFIEGLYWFTRYINDTENTIGWYQSEKHQEFYGFEFFRSVFSRAANSREFLDMMAYNFQQLDEFRLERFWLLVEGPSEREFIDVMRIVDGDRIGGVNTYGGKGNIKPSRFELALENFRYRGFGTLIQVDSDSSATNKCQELIKKKLLPEANVFAFKKDFESAFPSVVLHRALEEMGIILELNWIERLISNPNAKTVDSIREKCGTNLSKITLARHLGNVFRNNEYLILENDPDVEILKWVHWLRGQKYA